MLKVNASSAIFGSAEKQDSLPETNFDLAINTISLSDLIARTVENQVLDLLDKQHRSLESAQRILDRHFLIEDEVRSQAKSGKIAVPDKPSELTLDAAREVRRAIDAFTAGKFKVFINGREYTDLNEQLHFDDAIKVKFLRIMPLQGG